MFSSQSKKFILPIDANISAGDDLSFLSNNSIVEQWQDHEADGQLAVDVAQTVEELIVVAPMAGTIPQEIELHLHNDLLTIRGERSSPAPAGADHFYQECYWGKFSRTIVLPAEVRSEMAQAQYRNGVLLIRLPKKSANNEIKILVVED
jgi:HSP20 family protein